MNEIKGWAVGSFLLALTIIFGVAHIWTRIVEEL